MPMTISIKENPFLAIKTLGPGMGVLHECFAYNFTTAVQTGVGVLQKILYRRDLPGEIGGAILKIFSLFFQTDFLTLIYSL